MMEREYKNGIKIKNHFERNIGVTDITIFFSWLVIAGNIVSNSLRADAFSVWRAKS